MFQKKQVSRTEICDIFCHLPDNIKVYLGNDTYKYNTSGSKITDTFRFIDSQITIKENGN